MSAFRQMSKLGLASLAALSLVAAGAAAAQAAPDDTPTPAADAATVTLDLVGINDFHGRISPNRASAGAAVLAGAVEQLRSDNANTLFVSAGDNIGASTFASSSQQDNPAIDALGAAGLAVSAVGNHEFDKGFDDLRNRVADRYADATGEAGGDLILGANVYEQGTMTPALQEYAIREVAGLSVGFIGTVTEDVPSLVSPDGIAALDFGSELDAANRVAGQLSDGNAGNGEADVIVLLTHNGSAGEDCAALASEDTSYGELVRGASAEIDAIFSGHTHQSYDCLVAGPNGERPVIQSDEYGTTLGKISLTVDAQTGDVVESAAQRLPLATEDADGNWSGNYAPNAAVAEIVAKAEAEAEVVGSVKVGEISEDILRGGEVPGDDRGVESTLGNTVADIHLWATSNEDFAGEPADIAFMNPGGLRADLLYGEDGTVTYQEAAEVQPFANTLITFNLTGAQIREALEQQWQPDGSERAKLHLGISEALSYTYVEDAAQGEHIQDIAFNGEPLDENATFRVAANAFLATGGDNFTAFAAGTDHTDSGQIDLDATVNYFKAHDVVAPAPLGRAVIAGTDWAAVQLDSAEVAAGDALDVTVTGLDEGARISASAFGGSVAATDIPAANASGTTQFQLPVDSSTEPGEYTLVISQVQHEDVRTSFTVVAAATEPVPTPTEDETAAPEPSEAPESPAPDTDSEDTSDSQEGTDKDAQQQDNQHLADTGFSASWIGIAAAVIVLAGIILLLVRRFSNKSGR